MAWSTDLAVKEDGQRVALTDDNFEWWYFDTIMEDGSTCVLNFLSKRPFFPGPTAPILQFNIGAPGGKYFQCEATLPADTYSAATEQCDVRMGKSWVKGDLHTYTIHAEGVAEKYGTPISADLTLCRVVPSWRPGPYLNPDEAAKNWLGEQVVIPSGTVEGTLTYDGATHKVRGTCYHDHQWGGKSPPPPPGAPKIVPQYWYWGRVQAGHHAVDVAQVFGTVDGSPTVPIQTYWMFARGSAITFDDTVGALTVTQKGERPAPPPVLPPSPPPKTPPPPIPATLDFAWSPSTEPGQPPPLGTVRFSLSSEQAIANFSGGGYYRFVCPVTLTSDFAGDTVSEQGHAIWEIMNLAEILKP
ncbi:MAG: hypothetical protein WCE79_26945 [Xanthobacteraceae bacterium]